MHTPDPKNSDRTEPIQNDGGDGGVAITSTEKLPITDSVASVEAASLKGADSAQDNGDNDDVDKDIEAVSSYGAGRQRGWRRYLGVIYTIIAINLSALAANILKLLSHVNPITVSMYSFIVGIPIVLPFILYRYKISKRPILENVTPLCEHKTVIFLLWLRSSSTILVMFTVIWSIQFITVADSRTIFAASVIVVNILGSLFFHEAFGYVTAIVTFIALCGIVVMAKPPILTGGEFNINTLIGVSIALGCMLCASLNMLIIRFLKVYHGFLNLFLYTYASFCTLLFAIGFDKLVIPKATTLDILEVVAHGALAALTNTFLVLALQVEEAGTVCLVRTCEIIFTFIWQTVLLNVKPDWLSILGAALVLTGVVVVGLRKWLESKDEDNPLRKRLRWLLL